ncbi:MAG: hypothetical protein EPO57_09120 [Chitinophagaceae bacterium]|nr:MAG: hypothetical protein EPO57_09120 [Chitinophagaceae bacterium]
MPVPTISSVTPNAGLTGGKRLVAIAGTNFQLPPAPAPFGVTTPPNPSVEVLFGGVKGTDVRVLTTGLLHVTTPIHDAGLVDVVVRNIDQNGVLVGAETVTSVGAFTFARPDLNTGPTNESDFTRLVRNLILELRRQVVDNVELTVHTDYDDSPSGANVAMLSTLPGLVLSGPALRENRFFSMNEPRVRSLGGGQYQDLRPPYTVDLVFTLIGVDDSTPRLLNLMKETVGFFQRNKVLRIPRDVALPNGEQVEYEMEIEPDGDFDVQGGPNNSNVRNFSGTFAIRGFDIDDPDMAQVQTAALVDVVPSGTVGVDGLLPSPIILGSVPGVTPAPPIPPGPAPAPGAGGVTIEQLAPGKPPGPSPG